MRSSKIWRSILARLYPSAWRARYGTEFDALLEEVRPGGRDTLDVLRSAVEVHMTGWTAAKLAVAAGLAGAAIAGVIAFRMPEQFTARGTVRLQDSRGDGLVQEAISRNFAVQMIQKYGLYSDELRRMPVNDVIEQMRARVQVTAPAPDTLEIAFTDEDAGNAQKVTQGILRQIVEIGQGRAPDLSIVREPELAREGPPPGRARSIVEGLLLGAAVGGIGAWLRRQRVRWILTVAACALGGLAMGAALSVAWYAVSDPGPLEKAPAIVSWIPNSYTSSAVLRVPPGDTSVEELLSRDGDMALHRAIRIRRTPSVGYDLLTIECTYGQRYLAQRFTQWILTQFPFDWTVDPASLPVHGSFDPTWFMIGGALLGLACGVAFNRARSGSSAGGLLDQGPVQLAH